MKRCKRCDVRANPALLVIRNPADPPVAVEEGTGPASSPAPAAETPADIWPELVELTRKKKLSRADVARLDELAKVDEDLRRVLKRHRDFHGNDPTSLSLADVPGVKDLGFRVAMALGDGEAIEYSPHERSARGRSPPFRHAFAKQRNLLVTDPRGRGVFIAKTASSKLRVTRRGIEG